MREEQLKGVLVWSVSQDILLYGEVAINVLDVNIVLSNIFVKLVAIAQRNHLITHALNHLQFMKNGLSYV